MQNLEFNAEAINESMAHSMIFDACRANPTRKAWQGIFAGVFYAASFQLNADGSHSVAIRNEDRVVIATAKVDEFDC